MLSKSALFSAIPCPDKNCQRPHCKFKHDNKTVLPQLSAPVISQEEDTQLNNYVGYYNATPSSSTAATAYDPFATTYNYSSTSYAPEATNYSSTSYSSSVAATDAYTPAPLHGYEDDSAAAMQGYNNDNAGGFSFDDDVTTASESKKRTRRDSSEYVDPSKPVLPPDIGDDEILQFGRPPKPKESKKAKKPAPKVLTEAQTPANKKDTEKANEYMKKVADLDRELDELKRKRKAKMEENLKKASIDVDSLFEDDDPAPPPKKISKPSTSRDSTDSTKIKPPVKASLPELSTKPASTVEKDVIVITHKPPPPPTPKGSRVAHQPTAPVPTIKKKPQLKDQLDARMKALASATITKTTNTVTTSSSTSSSKQPTISSAFNKGQPRIAHVPVKASPTKAKAAAASSTKPTLKEPYSSKIPSGLRQRILDKLVDEFVKFMARSDAIIIAQDEEFEMLSKSSTRQGYTSSISGVIRRIREISDKKSTASATSKSPGISHLDVLKGRHAKDVSVGVNKHQKKNSEIVSEYSEPQLYEALFDKYLMTDEQLEENGYPLWEDETTKEKVKIKTSELDAKNVNYVDPKNPIRTCCRCKATYRVKVYPEDVIEKSDCVYHWGKFWKKKVQGREWIARWTCCDMGEGVNGCSLAKQHVTQQQTTDVFESFVEAPPRREGYDERSLKVYALDCEMVYTSLGPAVARLSVVDYKGDKILDEIIKPPGELLDTNFRFSGLEEDDVLKAKIDLAGAQQRFFEIVNRDSILIGHSLESDLKAMRIVHKNVIDTSVLFPHRLGPPYKRALKNLSSEILMEIIQEDVTGHDSAEDAQIALKLVMHKLKNE